VPPPIASNCAKTGSQASGPGPRSGKLVTQWNQGENQMVTEHEAAAAILVQTIFLKDGHLQGILGEQASKSATLAVEFLKPFYAAALAMMAKVGQEALESR
jgi:hypothetical protein